MTIDEKIGLATVRVETLSKRVLCCMWLFLVCGVCMFANAAMTLYHAAEWAHYISASGGQMPWTSSLEQIQETMDEVRDKQPTETDFVLYNSMMTMGGLTALLTLVFLSNAKGAKWASKARFAWGVRFALCKGTFCFFVFSLCYLCLRGTSLEVMDVIERLEKNVTVPAHDFADSYQRPMPRYHEEQERNLDDLSSIVGTYQSLNLYNGGTDYIAIMEVDGQLEWLALIIAPSVHEFVKAGMSWSLNYENGELTTGADCPYGEQKVLIMRDGSIRFLGSYYEPTSSSFYTEDKEEKKHGVCPVFVALFFMQLLYLVTLYQLKHAHMQIHILKKAKDIVAKAVEAEQPTETTVDTEANL